MEASPATGAADATGRTEPAPAGADAAAARTAAERELPYRTVAPGDRLGRYEVIEAIGEGGMATVFRARDPELRRDVAIKVLFPHLSRRADIVRRFQREARAAARLRHPAILQTYDVGGGEGGEPPYIVMELVRGTSLQEHLAARAPMLSELAACAGVAIAEALAVAHQAGVIHRDLKPANLLVSGDGRLLLADFGVAHVERDESLATRTGAVLGTPAYMSPEQASGEEIDARSDLYALGATLYHLVTGAPPFSGSSMKVMSQLATPGALVPPQQRRPAVGRPLSAAIVELMAYKPASRPASARDAAALLRPLAGALGEPAANPAEELAAFCRDPEEAQARQLPRVVAALVEQGRRARAEGRLAAAMALADRAASLTPDDQEVRTLVDEVTSQQTSWRRWRRAAALAVPALGAAALVMALWGSGGEPVGDGGGGAAGSGSAAIAALAEPAPSIPPPSGGEPGSDGAPGTVTQASDEAASRGASRLAGGEPARSSGSGAGTRPRPEKTGSTAATGLPSSGSGTKTFTTKLSGSGSESGSGSGSGSGSASGSASASGSGSGSATASGSATESGSGSATASGPAAPPPSAPPMAAAIFAMDAWCELSIDGKPHGRADRNRVIALPAGKHTAACTQGPGLGEWRGELQLTAGETSRVTGELRMEVSITVEVAGTDVTIDGKPVANRQRLTVRNGRLHVTVRDGDRQLASDWVSIPRVSRCTLRDRPVLDCYP